MRRVSAKYPASRRRLGKLSANGRFEALPSLATLHHTNFAAARARVSKCFERRKAHHSHGRRCRHQSRLARPLHGMRFSSEANMLQSIPCVLVAASVILATAAQAAWPERPVTVPFTPGGITD